MVYGILEERLRINGLTVIDGNIHIIRSINRRSVIGENQKVISSREITLLVFFP